MKLTLRLRVLLIIGILLFGIAVLSGCTSKTKTESANNGEPDPITLKIHFAEDEAFIDAFIKPAEEKFPYITFEHVEGDLEELIAARKAPDILWFWDQGWLEHASELEMTYDMRELIEETGFDISRFNPNQLAEWQEFSGEELWVLPMSSDRFALMYNKDIFDLFGVEYPADGMTWEEVVDLARKLTGERNGMEYQGLYMPKSGAPIAWTAGNLVDPETDEPLWTNNDTVRNFFELYKEVYSIPGNPYIPEHWEEEGWPELFAQGKLAMAAHWFMHPGEESNVSWDVATYPEPENGVPAGGWAMGISSTSEYKEEVMKVFDFWYSDEQLMNNTFTGGPLSVPYAHLYDDGSAVERALELFPDLWEGRNMEALFSLPVAEPLEEKSKYQNDDIVYDALYEYIDDDQMDLNTLMREKYEEELVRIEEEKAKE
ncbi:ABC transporter substrate-binding protein [Bacillus sp. SD088]|uniref:ABC transporter substrate-binding protein n=1 Tax=Bacillus sp. SD088 TaxID=2782012 RepID=UPI001A962920|nr:extracellular solute-binding protein [Bacillus sp. SD088]MBO0994727.1 extracellular solute-binding protein [Bacillus sp. SD088]